MTTTILIANQKGGVGKTTTAVTLAHGLARQGHSTLLIDLDTQGHAAIALGLQPQPGLHQLIVGGVPLPQVVVKARENLYLLPGDQMTERTKRDVASMDFREKVLLNVLQKTPFDIIIIDSAPSTDVLHVAAMVVSDYMVVPTKLDPLSVDGVRQILGRRQKLEEAGYSLTLAGIIPTFFERRTNESLAQSQDLVRHFGKKVWPPIPQDSKARSAPAFGQTLLEYAPNSPCMIGYETVNERTGRTIRIGGYAAVLKELTEAIGLS